MSDNMKIDYAAIHGASDDCKKAGGQLQSLFDDLTSKLRPLTDTWEGEAKDAYHQRQVEWNQKHDAMNQVLAQIAAVLPQIADSYQGTEGGIAKSF
jgi:early secretory antigenic target protein ESAT-6